MDSRFHGNDKVNSYIRCIYARFIALGEYINRNYSPPLFMLDFGYLPGIGYRLSAIGLDISQIVIPAQAGIQWLQICITYI